MRPPQNSSQIYAYAVMAVTPFDPQWLNTRCSPAIRKFHYSIFYGTGVIAD